MGGETRGVALAGLVVVQSAAKVRAATAAAVRKASLRLVKAVLDGLGSQLKFTSTQSMSSLGTRRREG